MRSSSLGFWRATSAVIDERAVVAVDAGIARRHHLQVARLAEIEARHGDVQALQRRFDPGPSRDQQQERDRDRRQHPLGERDETAVAAADDKDVRGHCRTRLGRNAVARLHATPARRQS